DHADAVEVGWAVANQHGALQRRAYFAVLDSIGLGHVEHVLARGDVDLTAAEVDRVDAVLDRRDDLGRVVAARKHVGVGHAWHRHMRVAFASPVAGRLHVHQPRVLAVLHVTHEDAVLDQHGAVGGRAFVIDRERAAALRHGAVVDHGHALGGDALAHEAGKGGGPFAVEVAFEPVPDRLVQHHARPAGAEHDVHLASRRGYSGQGGERGAHRLVDGVLPAFARDEARKALAPAIAVTARFLAVAFTGHDRDVDAHERPHVAIALAVAAQDLDHLPG